MTTTSRDRPAGARPRRIRLPPAGGALPSLLLLAAGWALTLWVAPWSDQRVNDLFVYTTVAEPLLAGALPYRDFAFEYPPLAAPLIGLPGIAGTGEETFRWAYALWTLGAAAAVVLLCGALARAGAGDPRRAMLAAALAPLLCGAVLRTHFDLFPVALLLAALLLVCHGRPRLGLAVLGAGAMTKAFPLVALSIALTWIAMRHGRREARQAALACAAVVAVLAAGALALSPDGAADAVRYHLERPVQIESTPALVLLGLDAAGVGEAASVSSHRSDGLLHPAAAAVTSLFAAALVALVTLLCVSLARLGGGAARELAGDGSRELARDGSRELARDGTRGLLLAALAAAVGFAVLGKVLSPQFIAWAIPLGALAFAWRLHALALAVALSAVLTQLEFPARYFHVVAREPGALALVAARNLALLGVIALALRELQLRRHQQLLHGRRAALAVGVD